MVWRAHTTFWKIGLMSKSQNWKWSCIHPCLLWEMRHHLHFQLCQLLSFHPRFLSCQRSVVPPRASKWVKLEGAEQSAWLVQWQHRHLSEGDTSDGELWWGSVSCRTSLSFYWGLCTELFEEPCEGLWVATLSSLGLSAQGWHQQGTSPGPAVVGTRLKLHPEFPGAEGSMLVLEQCFKIHEIAKCAISSHLERQAENVHCAPALSLLWSLNPCTNIPRNTFWAGHASWCSSSVLGHTDAQSQLISGKAAQGTAACLGGCWTAVSAMT